MQSGSLMNRLEEAGVEGAETERSQWFREKSEEVGLDTSRLEIC